MNWVPRLTIIIGNLKVKKQDCICPASYCAWNPNLYHLIFNHINKKLYVYKGRIMRNRIKYREENEENWMILIEG